MPLVETIADLLSDSDESEPERRLVISALRQLLQIGHPGSSVPLSNAVDFVARWRDLRAQELLAIRARIASGAWLVYADCAVRRDSVKIMVVHDRGTADPADLTRTRAWSVLFPQSPHQPAILQTRKMRPRTMAEAISYVDGHWPMPPWWCELDAGPQD